MAAPYVSLACLFLLLSIPASVQGKADDSMCPQDLTKLLPCLNYVQGKATAPSKECCTNLLDVHLHEPVCLCELIAASAEGGNSQLPPMNTTLALNMGPVCEVKTKPSICPGLLGISSSSPQAKIFENANSSGSSSGAPPTTPSSNGGSTPSNNPSSSNLRSPSDSTSLSASILAPLIATAILLLVCSNQ